MQNRVEEKPWALEIHWHRTDRPFCPLLFVRRMVAYGRAYKKNSIFLFFWSAASWEMQQL